MGMTAWQCIRGDYYCFRRVAVYIWECLVPGAMDAMDAVPASCKEWNQCAGWHTPVTVRQPYLPSTTMIIIRNAVLVVTAWMYE